MKQKLKYIVGVVLLMAAPHLSFAQYFQSLYDVDSSQDWGVNISVQPDNNYIIFGTFLSSTTEQWGLFSMQVSADGNTLLSKHIVQYDNISLYTGVSGQVQLLTSGGYMVPFTAQIGYDSNTRSCAGFLKYNASGDTVLSKTYTDTSIHFDVMLSCSVMPDQGYILGGLRGINTPSNYSGYIVRTDSAGDTLWTHTYQKYPSQYVDIFSVIPLPDGRIVAGATSTYIADAGPPYHYTYTYNTPWFLVLDGMGNILKDTLFSSNYIQSGGVCGELYKDMDGGYINIGQFDSLYTSDPSDNQNFPGYIAHLDTNFHITWITSFSYSDAYGHRQPVMVLQQTDSSYIVVGDDWSNYINANLGWAVKVSHNGTIVWSHTYYSDSTDGSYIRAVAEKADGSLVFTGESMNDTMPAWHTSEDMWLVGVDSNGCEVSGGCGNGLSTGVAPSGSQGGEVVRIYPNPTSGGFTVEAPSGSPQGGEVLIYNVEGQCVAIYKIKGGTTNLQLPAGISAGMYICKYISEGDGVPAVVRLVYAP